MSVFTSFVTKVLEVPGDAGHTITIRKLSPKHLERARRTSQLQSLEDLRAMGGPAFIKELQGLQEREPDMPSAIADPLNRFDRGELMQHGVTAWTYGRDLGSDAFDDLDDATSEWLAREILRLAKPELFEASDAEAARKNASGPSIVH